MGPTRLEDSPTMESTSRKRPAPSDPDHPTSKRQRTSSSHTIPSPEGTDIPRHGASVESPDELAKKGLRRSIGLVLDKIGFDSADHQALETFTQLAEACALPPRVP